MATLLFANNATATIAGAITNTSLTVNLQAGEGALFPNPGASEYFVGTFMDQATGLITEIVWCTARSGDVLTIVRAQESTTAKSWNAGDFFNNLWTAGQCQQMLQQGQAPSSIIYFGIDTGSVNAIAATVAPVIGSLTNGNIFEITVLDANTSSSVTANIGATGVFPIARADGTLLRPGDLQPSPYAALLSWNSATSTYLLLNPCTWASASVSIVGAARQLRGIANGATVTAAWTANEFFAETSLGGLCYKAISQTFSFNGATTGAGGMDTGSFPSGVSDLAIYAIYNPSTNTWSCIGTITGHGNIYSGANMPSGYTASGLLWAGKTGGGNMPLFGQIDRDIYVNQIQVLTSHAGIVALASLSIASAVPAAAVKVFGDLSATSSVNSSGIQPTVAATGAGIGQQFGSGLDTLVGGGACVMVLNFQIPLMTAQTIFWATTSVSTTANMFITGYSI